MVALKNDVTAIWREVAAIERQIADETRWQRERMAQLKGERDALLLKLLELEGAHERGVVAAR